MGGHHERLVVPVAPAGSPDSRVGGCVTPHGRAAGAAGRHAGAPRRAATVRASHANLAAALGSPSKHRRPGRLRRRRGRPGQLPPGRAAPHLRRGNQLPLQHAHGGPRHQDRPATPGGQGDARERAGADPEQGRDVAVDVLHVHPRLVEGDHQLQHIMQMKMPGTDSLPILTMSLQRVSGVPKIQLRIIQGGVTVGSTNLAPLQDRWIGVELEMTIGDAPNGKVRWVLRNGTSTVIDVSRSGLDTWMDDRVRPKWGIYRSLGDTSGSLQNCFLLLTNMRAYQWSTVPTLPSGVRYEAENATLSRAVVESEHAHFTGTGYVNYDNVTGSSVTFTVNAPNAGNATLTFRYANGTTTGRPMDIAVNGTVVAAALA